MRARVRLDPRLHILASVKCWIPDFAGDPDPELLAQPFELRKEKHEHQLK